MSDETKRPHTASAHTPMFHVPVKDRRGNPIKSLSSTPKPSPLQNVIVRRKDYDSLKQKIKDLESQYRAVSASYSVQHEDNKQLEAKIADLEKRNREREEQVALEQRIGSEGARRERVVLQENARLHHLLSTLWAQRGDGKEGDVMETDAEAEMEENKP